MMSNSDLTVTSNCKLMVLVSKRGGTSLKNSQRLKIKNFLKFYINKIISFSGYCDLTSIRILRLDLGEGLSNNSSKELSKVYVVTNSNN